MTDTLAIAQALAVIAQAAGVSPTQLSKATAAWANEGISPEAARLLGAVLTALEEKAADPPQP